MDREVLYQILVDEICTDLDNCEIKYREDVADEIDSLYNEFCEMAESVFDEIKENYCDSKDLEYGEKDSNLSEADIDYYD